MRDRVRQRECAPRERAVNCDRGRSVKGREASVFAYTCTCTCVPDRNVRGAKTLAQCSASSTDLKRRRQPFSVRSSERKGDFRLARARA